MSLKMEADLDATCLEKGWTPLMYAAAGGYVEAVLALLEAGSRVNLLSNPTGEGEVRCLLLVLFVLETREGIVV